MKIYCALNLVLSHAKNGTEFLTLTVRKLIHLLEKDTLALCLTLVFCVVAIHVLYLTKAYRLREKIGVNNGK